MTAPSPAGGHLEASHSAPARLGSLDGLRAIAVTAVVIYHVDHTLLEGGFVGVDLFFVLSGFLITSLLVREKEKTGKISLRSFWGRRVRRLWPLAWVTLGLIAIASIVGVWGLDRQRTVPAELAASFAHIANWYQAGHGGYIQGFAAPSPVRHFWSLAIEEQFYLVWPLVMAALLAVGDRSKRIVIPGVLALLASVSIWAGFVHAGDADRAYLGTDVRMVALVAGAALAWAFRGHALEAPDKAWQRGAAMAAGIVGASGLITFAFVVSPDQQWLARGGFGLVALGGVAVIAAAVSSPLWTSLLSLKPLVWLGKVSFAVYLVHWPLLVAIGPNRALWVRLVVAGPVTVVISWVLHRLVELPVMAKRYKPVSLVGGGALLAGAAVVALLVSVPVGETPTEVVAMALEPVADPVVVTTTVPATTSTVAADSLVVPDTTSPSEVAGATTIAAEAPPANQPTVPVPVVVPPCVPIASPSNSYESTDRFDPKTVTEISDPNAEICGGQVKVLVVGDSTGRGAANGLAALGSPLVQIWDRTNLGCSLGGEECPNWRDIWRTAIDKIDPEVVLLYNGPVADFYGVADPPFLSAEATAVRNNELTAAIQLLSSRGATVFLVTPAAPIGPHGFFYCGGKGTNSGCDPLWVDRWNASIRQTASAEGALVADTGGWVASRSTQAKDRPDGLHLAGPALVDHALWLLPQLVLAVR